MLDELQVSYLFPWSKVETTPTVNQAMIDSFSEMNQIDCVRKSIYMNILQRSLNTKLYISIHQASCMIDMRLVELGFSIAVAINRGISIENVFNLISAHSILSGGKHNLSDESFEKLLSKINSDNDARMIIQTEIMKANEYSFSQN